jgi:hypothetical protein
VIGELRKHLGIVPFRPFRIRTADGQEYPVPTVDHIYLPPGKPLVIVADDEGYVAILSALLISRLLYADSLDAAPKP